MEARTEIVKGKRTQARKLLPAQGCTAPGATAGANEPHRTQRPRKKDMPYSPWTCHKLGAMLLWPNFWRSDFGVDQIFGVQPFRIWSRTKFSKFIIWNCGFWAVVYWAYPSRHSITPDLIGWYVSSLSLCFLIVCVMYLSRNEQWHWCFLYIYMSCVVFVCVIGGYICCMFVLFVLWSMYFGLYVSYLCMYVLLICVMFMYLCVVG